MAKESEVYSDGIKLTPSTRMAIRALLEEAGATRANIEAALDLVETGAAASQDRILRKAEVAAMLGCTTRTVDNLARRGAFRKVEIGGRTFGILASDVIAAMNNGAANWARKTTLQPTPPMMAMMADE